MLFRSYVPRSRLREFVEDFWLYEDYAGEHLRERILPSGTFEMVFNLREDEIRIYDSADRCRRFAGALISGPYAESFMSDTAEEAAIMGVHFRPGGARAFLLSPASLFADMHLDLSTIWGPGAAELRERLCALNEPLDRFRLLEEALLARLSESPRRHGAVGAAIDALMRSNGRARIRDVAETVDLSRRRLIDLFAAEVGLTPKLFGRIQRFQRVLPSVRGESEVDWAALAVECGYFDQSHLIHEFAEFSGVSPSDYWRRQNRLHRAGAHVKRHHLPLAG